MHTHSPGVLLASVTPYEAHIFPSVQSLIINLVTLIIFFIFIHITDTLSSIPCQYTEPGAPWDYPVTLFTLCPFSHVPRPNHFFSKWYVHAQALSHVWLSVILWTVACQAPLPTRFSKNTGVDCHALLQGIFLTQVSSPYLLSLLHWQADSLLLSYAGSPSKGCKEANTWYYLCVLIQSSIAQKAFQARHYPPI